ncbi:MAG: hypothetical protein Q8L14_38130 [Myxococcales bacterium]|nr:hypothetical protein [Myxococcales bacterium]
MASSRTHRIVSTLFGVFFATLSVFIVTESPAPITAGPFIAALVVGVLGVDLVVSAARGKASLLSRIGPLP